MEVEASTLTDTVCRLLDEKKYNEALNFSESDKFKEAFKQSSWELIPVVVSKIQEDTLTINPQLYSTCEKLLGAFVEKGNTEEILLEIIEQTETAKNYAQFLIVLQPMQNVLIKLKNKRNRSLEWCFNAISTYIENLPTPEYHLEGEERLLLDNDDNIRIISKVYSDLPNFYSYFIDEMSDVNATSKNTKKVIGTFLIGLLGKPFIFIDVDPDSSAKSLIRKCCQTIILDLCKVEKDLLKILSHSELKYKENLKNKTKSDKNEEKDIYSYSELPMTSLSGLFYVALSGDFTIPHFALPQVYSSEYIVRIALLHCNHLLSFTAYGPLVKGLSLCKALFARLAKPVSHKVLLSQIYIDVIKSLVNVTIFSTYDKIRKEAVVLIGQQVNMFDYKGRSILIKSLLKMANHSGIIGYTITLFKNSLEELFKGGDNFPDCFVKEQMFEILEKIILLPHGAESDLMELADQIITALNFIIYLTQRDVKNITGIQDHTNYIKEQYLEKLRVGLNMSKAHYQVKLNDIKENKTSKNKIDVSINVGGNVLDDIPVENQEFVINSALNSFHLMEGLLARAEECVENNIK